jgi:hypothetical protein
VVIRGPLPLVETSFDQSPDRLGAMNESLLLSPVVDPIQQPGGKAHVDIRPGDSSEGPPAFSFCRSGHGNVAMFPPWQLLPLRRAEAKLKQMAHRLGMRRLTVGLRPSVDALCKVGRQSYSAF